MLTRKTVRGDIPSSEIKAAYQKAFHIAGEGWLQNLLRLFYDIRSVFNFADAYYKEADEELIQMILDADQGDKEEYETEWYDCDDFTFRLMGILHCDKEAAAMPIFIIWVSIPEGGHAVLSYYKDGQVKIIEPQTDQIFPVPKDWSLMLLCG
jgi:hypothetical protein